METGFTVILVVAGLIIILALWNSSRKKKAAEAQPASPVGDKGIPEGMEEDYRRGVDPCGCGKPVMYTLHTCRHCVHLKKFLDKHGVEHHLVYVDEFANPARREIMATLRSFNPRGSFPTFVVPDGRCVVGFREEAVKELLGLE